MKIRHVHQEMTRALWCFYVFYYFNMALVTYTYCHTRARDISSHEQHKILENHAVVALHELRKVLPNCHFD